MTRARLQMFGVILLVVTTAVGATWLAIARPHGADDKGAAPKNERISQKMGNILKIGAPLAESYGIEATPAKAVSWHPKIAVDGRVLPNPHATLEVRAPFAGVLQAEIDTPSFRLGAQVKAQQTLAHFEARFSPAERLDFKTKIADAEARVTFAEETVKLRTKRKQLLTESGGGNISRADLDKASIELSEAQMQKEIALMQWNIWKNALESAGTKNIVVPIRSPIMGEIAEIGAQPGANVEAGQMLLRIVDFRRVLVRLDFPLVSNGAAPPVEVEVETPTPALETPTRWHATWRGTAPTVEIGLQKTSHYYEIVPSDQGTAPGWRPGLYVKAVLNDPAKTTLPAVAIPASALLVHQGRTLVYVQLNPGRYERREVHVIGREGDTLFVFSGVREDEMVVSKHPQALLSEEFRSDVDDD